MKPTAATVRLGTGTGTLSQPRPTCWSRSVWRGGGKSERGCNSVHEKKKGRGRSPERARESEGGRAYKHSNKPSNGASFLHAQWTLFTCKQVHETVFVKYMDLFPRVCMDFIKLHIICRTTCCHVFEQWHASQLIRIKIKYLMKRYCYACQTPEA